jgi:hypothetical protein
MAETLHRRLIERKTAMDTLILAVAAEHGEAARTVGALPPRLVWRLVEEAEVRYRAYQIACQGASQAAGSHPVMRGRTDIALANLYGVDHDAAFPEPGARR